MKFQVGEKVVIYTPEVDMFVLGRVIAADLTSFEVQLSDGATVIERQDSELFEWVH